MIQIRKTINTQGAQAAPKTTAQRSSGWRHEQEWVTSRVKNMTLYTWQQDWYVHMCTMIKWYLVCVCLTTIIHVKNVYHYGRNRTQEENFFVIIMVYLYATSQCPLSAELAVKVEHCVYGSQPYGSFTLHGNGTWQLVELDQNNKKQWVRFFSLSWTSVNISVQYISSHDCCQSHSCTCPVPMQCA